MKGKRHERRPSAYGLWSLVLVNSVVFILFAYSFFKPQTARDWRSFSAFSAFLVALFAEMYGFPLTIYFLSGWLQSRYPNVDWFSHDAGHLLEMMFGWKANPHFGPFHILSFVLIGAGFLADRRGLADPLRRSAAPQPGDHGYPTAMSGIRSMSASFWSCSAFLLQWPTLLDARDVSGARHHVRQAGARTRSGRPSPTFGDDYRRYMAEVPGFFPRLARLLGGCRTADAAASG